MKRSMKRITCILMAGWLCFSSVMVNANPVKDWYDSVMASKVNKLDDSQKTAIAMLNYLSVLTQEIKTSKNSRLYLENVYSSILSNLNSEAIDSRTEAQLSNMLDTLEKYRMVDVKRERLEYIYQYNKAQAIRSAIPNPIGLLSAVESQDKLRIAASVVYMAVDSVTSYTSENNKADMEYLKDNWGLDDEESAEIHNSRKQMFNYMLGMQKDNDLPDELLLRETDVDDFVDCKNDENVYSRIQFLETNQKRYAASGTYWLTLAKSYYDNEDFDKCIEAIETYKREIPNIFKKDIEYAKVLPMAIVSLKEIGDKNYVKKAKQYVDDIVENSNDWTLGYFAAQTCVDLYSQTKDNSYLQTAYDIALNNVNSLKKEQIALNEVYQNDVKTETVPKGATKEQKKDIKKYNKLLKEKRKTELPPVSEPLLVNCELLFALSEQLDIPNTEKTKIDGILHQKGEPIFLVQTLDDMCRFSENEKKLNIDDAKVTFKKTTFKIPAIFISDDSKITVSIKDKGKSVDFDDWKLSKVDRKKSKDCQKFIATYKSKKIKKIKIHDGDQIIISITPESYNVTKAVSFEFKASVKDKKLLPDKITYKRVK